MYPLPFGKFSMHWCVEQNCESVAWLIDPGPSTLTGALVAVPEDAVPVPAEEEGAKETCAPFPPEQVTVPPPCWQVIVYVRPVTGLDACTVGPGLAV